MRLRGQPGQIDVAAVLPRTARRQRDPRARTWRATTACRTRIQPALPAAGGRRLPRPAAPRGAGAGARGQCRHRQPAGVRRRRTSPRCVSGGNFHAEPVALAADAHGAGDRRGRRHRRAPHRDADRRRRLAPAAVPDRRRRAEQRLHDRPRHGGRARVARTSRWRTRPASTACRPAPTRKTTSVMATFAARRLQPMIAQHRAHPRHRAAGRGAGHRVPAPAAQLGRARAGARAAAQPLARAWRTTATSRPTSPRHRAGAPTVRWHASCARCPACRRCGSPA